MKKFLKDVESFPYHPITEQIVDIMNTKTSSDNHALYRVIVAYYFGVMASSMRATISNWIGNDPIPLNIYAVALAPSGSGKGHSTSLMERMMRGFQDHFLKHTLQVSAQQFCEQLAVDNATKNGTTPKAEFDTITKNFKSLGSVMFFFEEATVPAIRQIRQKLLMCNAGSLNLQIDEIGSNLSSSVEALTAYLPLYDKGEMKDKLLKSSAEAQRFEKIDGITPSNTLMFGTHTKLLDAGLTNELFIELLETGYARRSIFSYDEQNNKRLTEDIDAIISELFDKSRDDAQDLLANYFAGLADIKHLHREFKLTNDAIRLLVEYKVDCEVKAADLNDTETLAKAELTHRYFKAMKLAGVYAFIDNQSDDVTLEHVKYAIKLINGSSADSFKRIIKPKPAYVKLANYLGAVGTQVTLVELEQNLPSYRGNKQQKEEQLTLAIAYAFTRNLIIKRSYIGGVMLLEADHIEETNIDKLILSYSNDIAYGYVNTSVATVPKLVDNLLPSANLHWVNHRLDNKDRDSSMPEGGHRIEENIIPGFNMLVFDVDGGVSMDTAKMFLDGHYAIYHTTKRHTESENRFRIIMPISHVLHLNAEDYNTLYKSVVDTLPFKVDAQVGQRARKWLTTENTQVTVQEGELFNILPFIPRTDQAEEREKLIMTQENMGTIERWFINHTGTGNRNNMLIRYAFIMVESGIDYPQIEQAVMRFNAKMQDPLPEDEVKATVLSTVKKKLD